MAWDDNLRGPALNIAASNDSPLRVVAGPGTGKTYALKRRVARFLEIGVQPENILIVTFTRVAAQDIEKEINELNVPGADRVVKGTLHSLCLSILIEAHVLENINRKPRMLMEYEKRFLLEDLGIYDNDEIAENYYDRRRRLLAFEAAWAREQNQIPGWPTEHSDRTFQNKLNSWLIIHEGLLVGEIISLTLGYLRTNPHCPEMARFTHILVDEYQDLNKAEQHLIDLISTNALLTIVGDEDQSIYEEFRYAHPEGISHFNEEHAQTIDIPLAECRRCPSNIVSMANNLISNNNFREDRELAPYPHINQGEIYLLQWDNLENESSGIADYLSQKINANEIDPGKTLILTPRRQIGYLIRDELRRRNIQAISFFQEEILDGNPKIIEESRAQQSLSLLKIMNSRIDRVAIRCWLGFGSLSLRKIEYHRLIDYCRQNTISINDALELAIDNRITIPRISGLLVRFRELKAIIGRLEIMSVEEIVNELFPTNEEWSVPFRAIIGNIDNTTTLRQITHSIESSIIHPEMPIDVNYVRIMSLHKSKGLTADNVIILGCLAGLLPNPPKEDDSIILQNRHMEEQRRLFYVAITRAKCKLILSSVITLPRGLAHKMRAVVYGTDPIIGTTRASPFLSELGSESPNTQIGEDWIQNI